MQFKILGTGSYLPPKFVTNEEVSTMVDTNDEWIQKRVGIQERRISVDETTSQMGLKAAKLALENSGVSASELDMILVATITADNITPTVSCSIQRDLGATCPAMDLVAACSGFVFSLQTAAAFLALDKNKKILVVGAERLSGIVDWSDRNTCIIFADGAGAAVVTGGEDNLLSCVMNSKGDQQVLHIPNVSGCSPFYKGEVVKERYIYMNGKETYKFAVNSLYNDTLKVMEDAGLKDEDIRWVIPHQANIRIIKEASRKLPISPEKFCSNIHGTGNTSAASIAILLDEMNRAGKLNRGDIILLTAFGGGLCSGAMAIRW